jgi:hypothetical protein
MIFSYMKKKGVQQNIAFLISIMIYTLPGFSVYLSWAECFPNFLSAMLSFYAGALAVKVFSKHLGEQGLSISKENMMIFCAIVLQVISLFNYQGMALVFVIPAFITLILKPEAPSKKRFIFFVLIVLVFIASLGIYFEMFKSYLHSSNIEMTSQGKVGGHNLVGKLQWFVGVLREASMLHLVLFKNVIIRPVLGFLIGLALVRDVIKKRFPDLFFLAAFCVLLILPHLIITESWGASRNFVLISLALVFYSVIRVSEIMPSLPVSVAGLAGVVFFALMCFNIWEGWMKPMKKDYNLVYDFAKGLPVISSDTLLVEVTEPAWNLHDKQSLLRFYFDEFNYPVFLNRMEIDPTLKCLYMETHPGIPVGKIDELLKTHQRKDTLHLPSKDLSLHKIPLNLNYQ